MKAIILAAGVGKRLGDFTKSAPKCLLPIGKETVLGREIRILQETGFSKKDIIVMGGYKSELLNDYDINLLINEQYESTDNSYTLGMALEGISDDVIIMDGDLVFDKQMLVQLIECSHKNAILTHKSSDLDESTGISVRDDGSISAIGKNIINSGYVYLSIFKVSKEAITDFRKELNAEHVKKTWYTAPLTAILNKHIFYNCITNYKWHEIDCPKDYYDTKKIFETGEEIL